VLHPQHPAAVKCAYLPSCFLQVDDEEAQQVYTQVVEQRGEAATPRVRSLWPTPMCLR
jgi:hypothetical protein